MKKLLLFALACSICEFGYAQTAWQLKKNRDGINIYTREIEGSRIKQVKVTCVVEATLSQLTALLMDAPAHTRWVYNTKESYLIRQVAGHHQVYYSQTSLPWPMTNRDVVVDMTLSQDPVTKILQVDGHSVGAILPEKKGIVRVPMSQVNWTVTPRADHGLDVVYIAQADPGGTMPAWLINAFITKGPLETFIKLRELVKEDTYNKVQYAFIKN